MRDVIFRIKLGINFQWSYNNLLMGDKNCDLFCFRECSDKYDTLILKKDMDSV
jgi:hypothetical protein